MICCYNKLVEASVRGLGATKIIYCVALKLVWLEMC